MEHSLNQDITNLELLVCRVAIVFVDIGDRFQKRVLQICVVGKALLHGERETLHEYELLLERWYLVEKWPILVLDPFGDNFGEVAHETQVDRLVNEIDQYDVNKHLAHLDAHHAYAVLDEVECLQEKLAVGVDGRRRVVDEQQVGAFRTG